MKYCVASLAPPSSLDIIDLLQQGKSIFLSWSPSFSPFSDPVTYHIEVEGTSSEQPRLLFSVETNSTAVQYTPFSGYCSTLTFTVYASNRAGTSDALMQTYKQLSSMLTAELRREARLEYKSGAFSTDKK